MELKDLGSQRKMMIMIKREVLVSGPILHITQKIKIYINYQLYLKILNGY